MEKPTVLIVEDENIIAEDLRNCLESSGYTVSNVVATTDEAVQHAQGYHPDVILMDIMLKGAPDGIALANRIQNSLNIPVVFLTAYADDATFQRAKTAEPYGYVTKPYRSRELQIAIEMAVYKHKAEAQLRQTQRYLSTILQSIGDAVIATDVNGVIEFMNPVAERLVGVKQEDALGSAFTEVFQTTTEGNSTVLFSRDGREIPIEKNASPIRDEESNVTGLVWVFRDVTERKKAEVQLRGLLRVAELKYRTLVEQIPAVTYISVSGNIVYVSPQLQKMFGFAQEEWLVDPLLWQKQLHPEDAERIISQRIAAFESGKRFRAEYRMVAKDGSIIWILDDAVAIKDEKDSPVFQQGVLMDVTEQKNAEIQLMASHKQLRALSTRLQSIREEERTRIARAIHDDLGQVLTAMRMNLKLLSKRLTVSSAALSKRVLLSEIASLSKIVAGAIQRVQQIATELRPEILDHLGLKSAMEWQLQEFQTLTGVSCTYECDCETIELPFDCATAVFRIFQETLTNVARHAGATQLKVQVKLADGDLVLEVHDNGVGISESAITDPKSLGLLTMRERALVLGGTFQVSGGKEDGTTVHLRVPLAT